MRYLKICISGPYINIDQVSYYEVEDDFELPRDQVIADQYYQEAVDAYVSDGSYIDGIVDEEGA